MNACPIHLHPPLPAAKMTGHFTSYQTRPSHELATPFGFAVDDGRIRGRVDGILAGGPAVPKLADPALWECKTMNATSWRETAAKGVTIAKPLYAAQIAIYQAYMGASVSGSAAHAALFTAINGDNADLHHELVPFDTALAQRMSDRGVCVLQAIDAGDPLRRIAQNPHHFACRACAWVAPCWRLPA